MGSLFLKISITNGSDRINSSYPLFELDNLLYKSDQCNLYFDQRSPVKPVKIVSPEHTYYLLGNFTFYNGYFDNLKIDTQIRSIDFLHAISIQEVFSNINGIYCCIQIHNYRNTVCVFTDYLGFYPLFLYKHQNQILISNEIKLIKEVASKALNWNQDAIQSYLMNGHLISNQSWYKEVTRLRPASLYEMDCNTLTVTSSYYWTWSQLKKLALPKHELINLYTEKFEQGINALRLDRNQHYGLSLSGGLDSRWIGNVASKNFKLNAFSFGHDENQETPLAQKVAKALKIEHELLIIPAKDWLRQRLQAFWKADGLLHLGHLHEAPVHANLSKFYPVYFHGFFGGGIYANRTECNQKISEAIAGNHFQFGSCDNLVTDSFYAVNSIDSYIIDQKIRHQAAHSIHILSSQCQVLLPFYNMDWMLLNYGVDDRMQLNSKFYLEVLSKQLSPKLLHIPWQRTGFSPRSIGLNTFSQAMHLPAIKEKFYQVLGKSRHFINYNLVDPELTYWLTYFKKDIKALELTTQASTREQKFRVLSLVLIMHMLEQNTWDVI